MNTMLPRRRFLQTLSALGIGTPVFHGAVMAMQESNDEKEPLTAEAIKHAAFITDFELTDEEVDEILDAVNENAEQFKTLRSVKLTSADGPAMHFKTLAGGSKVDSCSRTAKPINDETEELPESDEDIAFLPVHQLAALVKSKKLSSVRLTKIYLERLKKYGPILNCVVTLTDELALKQAEQADKEIAAGNYRGPLHGIPWGAKDLINVPGYPTTWGIPFYRDRELDDKATVVKRLEESGAVLVAKLSLGALAMGDKWFGGMTRNPWHIKSGSSGSSAGSASATVSGLVGFSLGSETLGSITTPSKVCGATGFRPTFGRVSRHGCMPLSWSMDKIGPICRSVEDCALVFDAIHGTDQLDFTVDDYEFEWRKEVELKGLKVGYQKSRRTELEDREDLRFLVDAGCELVEANLPEQDGLRSLMNIISVEGAAVFDEELRAGETDGWNTWPNTFKSAQLISGIDYLRAQRVRAKLMQDYEKWMSQFDVLINVQDVVHTNFTGHPSIVFPYDYRDRDKGKRPQMITLTGHLNQDDKLLAIAHEVQESLSAHLKRPPLEQWMNPEEEDEAEKKEADSEDKAEDDKESEVDNGSDKESKKS